MQGVTFSMDVGVCVCGTEYTSAGVKCVIRWVYKRVKSVQVQAATLGSHLGGKVTERITEMYARDLGVLSGRQIRCGIPHNCGHLLRDLMHPFCCLRNCGVLNAECACLTPLYSRVPLTCMHQTSFKYFVP